MSNPKILAVDLSNYSISASHGSDASYPVTNIQDYEYDTIWKSSDASSTPQYLWFDLLSTQTLDAIILHNYNIGTDPNGFITLSGSTNNSTWSAIATDSIAYLSTGPVVRTFTAASYRYIKVFLNGIIEAAPYIGNVFIGSLLEFNTPYEFGYKKADTSYQTTEVVTLDGRIRTSQIMNGRYIWELSFKLQDDTLANNFRTFIYRVGGKESPFYFIDTDGSTVRYVHLTSDYVPVTTYRYGKNNITLKMLEHQATR